MRERRVKQGQTVLFDCKEVLKGGGKGFRLLLMKNGPLSYTTEEGVKFWQKHPYQWVTKAESELLLKSTNPEFRPAEIEDVEDYYAD